MSIIRATQKLLASSRIKPQPEPDLTSAIEEVGVWFAQIVSSSFPGRSFVLYVHKPSMLCVLVPGKTVQSTVHNFNVRLLMLLKRFAFPDPFIDYMLKHTGEPFIVCKTNDRKISGFINSISAHLRERFYSYNEYNDIDVDHEENILMSYPHKYSSKEGIYFRPEDYWNNFFSEKNFLFDIFHSEPKEAKIRLKDGMEDFTNEEKLESENALLKLKLETEFGAKLSDETFGGRKALENQWLNYLYNFEQLHKDAKIVTIYEYIGSPVIKKADTLKETELRRELKKLLTRLNNYSITVSFMSDYEDDVKYLFITDELFQMQIEDIRMPGMVLNYIYEEFHPNHAFDLRNATEEFFNDFIEKDLEIRFYEGEFALEVVLNGALYPFESFKKLLNQVVEELKPAKISAITIENVDFDMEKNSAEVKGKLLFSRLRSARTLLNMEFKLNFAFENNYWVINAVKLS